MDIVSANISASSMQYDETEKLFYGTVLASEHGFGMNAFVVRAVYRDDELCVNNVLCAYRVETNGDLKVFVDERMSLRLTIGRGVPVTPTNTLEDGDEYADT